MESREDQGLERYSGSLCMAGVVLVSPTGFAQLGLQASLKPGLVRIRRGKIPGLSLPITVAARACYSAGSYWPAYPNSYST